MFAVLKAARQLKQRNRADFMRSLINIAITPNQPSDFIEKLHGYWTHQFDVAVPEWEPDRARFKDDGTAVIPWEQASQIMLQQMKVFKQVNGGH